MSVLYLLTAQRGIQQEVTLNTKHGVEAKTYEAVSFTISLWEILPDIQMGLVSGYRIWFWPFCSFFVLIYIFYLIIFSHLF